MDAFGGGLCTHDSEMGREQIDDAPIVEVCPVDLQRLRNHADGGIGD